MGISHTSRPILAIDTAASHPAVTRHPSHQIPRDMGNGGDFRAHHIPDTVQSTVSAKSSGPSQFYATNFLSLRHTDDFSLQDLLSSAVKRSQSLATSVGVSTVQNGLHVA